MKSLRYELDEHLKQKKMLEQEVKKMKQQMLHTSSEADEIQVYMLISGCIAMFYYYI